jgi:hypothetical protein
MSSTTRVEVKEGEAKTLKVTVTQDDSALDVSTATFSFAVKKRYTDATPVISKTNSDFVTTDAASGIIKIPLSSTDLAIQPFSYLADIKITFTASSIVKSQTFILEVKRAVT